MNLANYDTYTPNTAAGSRFNAILAIIIAERIVTKIRGGHEDGADNGYHGAGWFVSRGIAPGQGYRVVGVVRRSSTESFERIAHIIERVGNCCRRICWINIR